MSRVALVTWTALSLVAAGCGNNTKPALTSPSNDTAMKAKKDAAMKGGPAMKADEGVNVTAISSRYGRIVADRRGQSFYLFAKETSSRSRCYGACAKTWPPVLTDRKPTARSGAVKSLLGTTKRRDGKLQLTYAGHPMYLYSGDSPGVIKCHNVSEFGGRWLVVKPDGRAAS